MGVAEIEPFPCAVLKHHYPDVPNLGDINQIIESQIKALGHIDVVIFGFPCTDLSCASQRKGLTNADGTHTRSGLFFKCSQVAAWSAARWVVVENVPGLFSINEGRDFATVVGELVGAKFDVPDDGWRNSGFALGQRGLVDWAVLDAQYRYLAQRRERVFFVLDTGNWRDRPPLLADATSLYWHTPPSRQKGQGTTYDLAPSVRASGNGDAHSGFRDEHGLIPEVAWALQERDSKGSDSNTKDGHLIPTKSSESMAVRRLTPKECARLQGFPDSYLDIQYRNKPACDGPKYKALGNSMPVPVIRWLGERIDSVSLIKPGLRAT